jgi:hypothetical protein
MDPRRSKQPASSSVSILSSNPETLDGLQGYLNRLGVVARCARTIQHFDTIAPKQVTVAVIFPDDYVHAEVVALVKKLRRLRPQLLTLLVTHEPQRFFSVVAVDGRSIAPVLLPKPSFGWDILDAIRAHALAEQA